MLLAVLLVTVTCELGFDPLDAECDWRVRLPVSGYRPEIEYEALRPRVTVNIRTVGHDGSTPATGGAEMIVRGRVYGAGDLEVLLNRAVLTNLKSDLHIRADRNAPWSAVETVLVAARRAGMPRARFVVARKAVES
jgi:hypothetical protein